MVKRKPHHDLTAMKGRFANVAGLVITNSAIVSSWALGFALNDVVDVIQSLETRDFVKSETAHSPPNSRVWHDSYIVKI